MKKALLLILIALVFKMPSMAQEVQNEKPTWMFGVAAGANFNFFRGTTQRINDNLTVSKAFHDGEGIGLFVAPLIEYRFPNSVWGIMLQAGYDNRQGEWDQVISPCNCPMDLSTDLSYLSLEPSLRIAPFKNGFYVYGGPRFAYNLNKSFSYEKGTNPEYPDQIADPVINSEFGNVDETIISMQVGAGFDIPLSSNSNKMQFVLSPFVSFQPYFGQNPRSVESWNITTLRVGAAIKFGQGRNSVLGNIENITPKVGFTVNSPLNSPGEHNIVETFPLRNYVFFEKKSTEISNRYVLLKKDQVKNFSETKVGVKSSKEPSDRSKREMRVYYNILNILGERMKNSPTSTITLVGSTEEGSEEGKLMATSVKDYLVDIYEIEPIRILVDGNENPKSPSLKPGGTLELDLLLEEDRRVSIESNSPQMLMEFQTGPNAPMKSVKINGLQQAPEESFVVFTSEGAQEAFSSWKLELTDEKGVVQNFGPFKEDEVIIPGKSILGTKPKGTYKVKMIGTTIAEELVTQEETINVFLWTPTTIEERMRFSILYDFDKSIASPAYEKYLSEIVATKIPKNGKVVIQGHTDVIGEPERNQILSLERANDVKRILENALKISTRNDVTFEVIGFGEDISKAPFGNTHPEERFYNRTVVIDILPINVIQ